MPGIRPWSPAFARRWSPPWNVTRRSNGKYSLTRRPLPRWLRGGEPVCYSLRSDVGEVGLRHSFKRFSGLARLVALIGLAAVAFAVPARAQDPSFLMVSGGYYDFNRQKNPTG